VKGPSLTKEQMNMLDELHQAQIRMADFMFVIDPDGYIGSSTKSEIEYAHGLGKPIAFLEEPNSEDFKGVELANGLGTFNLYNR
jgi:hypothetical protein